MALMRWGKYHVGSSTYYYNDTYPGTHLSTYTTEVNYITGWSGYTFSQYSGFDASGVFGNLTSVAFVISSTVVHRYELETLGSGLTVVRKYLQATCSQNTNFYRSSFIEEVIAEAGTYPADGRSGSYWYTLIGGAEDFSGIKLRDTGSGIKIIKTSLNNAGSEIKIINGWLCDNGNGIKIL